MKKMLMILAAFSTFAVMANPLNGTYSSDHNDMICSGPWNHPFLPINDKLSNGIPSGALLKNRTKAISISIDDSSLEIKNEFNNGSSTHVTHDIGHNGRHKISKSNGIIMMKLKRAYQSNWDNGLFLGVVLNQRFVAKIYNDEIENLVIENYSANGVSDLKLKNRCVLPRITF